MRSVQLQRDQGGGKLVGRVRAEGKEPVLYVVGRKGVTYFRFRDRPVAASWTGFSERPGVADAQAAGEAVIGALLSSSETGIDELYLVYTEFRSLMTQAPLVHRLAPLELEAVTGTAVPSGTAAGAAAAAPGQTGVRPAYEFEPEADQLLAAIVPRYLNARIYTAMLDSAASESASRRRAMKSATDNADELITAYTRQMNSARQAAITQEISEIVGGANASGRGGK